MKDVELTDVQFQELMRLCAMYHREAEACENAKAYLAGCVMIGAALEAALLGTCDCYLDEIPAELIPKDGKTGKPKHILDWRLFQLLRIARECHWLAVGLTLDDEWNQKKAEVGDWAVALKDFRNLVHASRYIRDFLRSRVTKRRMEMCFDILDAAVSHFQEKLHVSLAVCHELNPRKLNEIQKIVEAHKHEIIKAWQDHFRKR
jgi:hypothetical protein